MATCLVSLGSNLGGRRQTIEQAIAQIDAHGLIQVTARSRLYETQPVGGPAGQGSFLNAAIRLETSLPPLGLLHCLQEVETQLGRTRNERWSARSIDLDLLLFAAVAMSSDELELPHPRMAFRRFVLEPAAEIAAEMIEPATNWSIAGLLRNATSLPNYVAITGPREISQRVAVKVSELLQVEHRIRSLVLADPDPKFASSPAGPDFHSAIEFVRRRAKVLAAAWKQPGAWFISDFDFRTSVLIAAPFAVANHGPRFARELGRTAARVPSPKLSCMLSGIHDMSPLDSLYRADIDTRTILATGRWHLSEWEIPRCPTLTLLGADEDRAVEELTSAILAMHDEPQLLS